MARGRPVRRHLAGSAATSFGRIILIDAIMSGTTRAGDQSAVVLANGFVSTRELKLVRKKLYAGD
jgi:hypothetical protein